MNWDAIGAIAETLGAVGVITSLVYLAGQIRHSREQMSQNSKLLSVSIAQSNREGRNEITLRTYSHFIPSAEDELDFLTPPLKIVRVTKA
jgi:hypothetical protein